MGDQETHDTLIRLAEIVKRRPDRVAEVYAEDAVREWPQSGERLRGPANIAAADMHHPEPPKITPTGIHFSGDIAVIEQVREYGGKRVYAVSILEIKDGKIVRQTDYFADPFEPPEWRSQWVERMEPAPAGR
jgi:hypothetical protein